LDDECFEITPDTLVYTPVGIVHRFQMFRDFETVAVATHYEGQKRSGHLLVDEAGPPLRTVPGFVVPGAGNHGPFPQRGSRCPLSELRLCTLAAGEEVGETQLTSNEHWLVVEGAIQLEVDGIQAKLFPRDMALLRAGAVRCIRADREARVALARE
jgi:mannose-6-phosphate isomerase-like protein (cupin superfamily)